MHEYYLRLHVSQRVSHYRNILWSLDPIDFLSRRDVYRQAPGPPLSGRAVKHASDPGAARRTATLVIFDCHIPGRQLVPVSADQDIVTVVTVRTRASEIMHITCVDIAESVL